MTRKRDCILCQARAPLCSYYPSRGLALRRKRVAFGLAGETAGFRTPHIRFRTAPTKCVDTSLREGRPIFFQRTLSCVSRGFFRQQKSLYRKKRDKPMLVSFSGLHLMSSARSFLQLESQPRTKSTPQTRCVWSRRRDCRLSNPAHSFPHSSNEVRRHFTS